MEQKDKKEEVERIVDEELAQLGQAIKGKSKLEALNIVLAVKQAKKTSVEQKKRDYLQQFHIALSTFTVDSLSDEVYSKLSDEQLLAFFDFLNYSFESLGKEVKLPQQSFNANYLLKAYNQYVAKNKLEEESGESSHNNDNQMILLNMKPLKPQSKHVKKAAPIITAKRTMSVDGRKNSFIINKKSSLVQSKVSIFDNLLFDDVPVSVKQAYLGQLEQQIKDLNQLKNVLETNIGKQQTIKIQQIAQHQEQFQNEILNVKNSACINPEVLKQSLLLLQADSEFQSIDPKLLEVSYLKDFELLKCSNKFIQFENEFL